MTDTTTLAQQMVAAVHVATCNVNLTLDSTPLAVADACNAKFRDEGVIGLHNTPGLVGVTDACEKTNPLTAISCSLGFHKQNSTKLHSGAGVSAARFILPQTIIHHYAPFLINRENVI